MSTLNFHIQTPQLLGIIAGCMVFSVTIAVVIYLLVSSGTLSRALEEIRTGQPATPAGVMKSEKETKSEQQIDQYPQLYEELLDAARSLPATPCPPTLTGRTITLKPFLPSDVRSLVAASNGSAIFGESSYEPARIWGWIHEILKVDVDREISNPAESEEVFKGVFIPAAAGSTHLTIIDNLLETPIGMLSLVDNSSYNLTIRIDNLWLTPAYQGKKKAHEAMFNILAYLFTSGYRRVTVEVDSRHVIMRKFLERCGFLLEAVMRKHRVVRRRNRDTAVYAVVNSDRFDVEVKLKRLLGYPLGEETKKAADIGSFTPAVPTTSPSATQSSGK